MSKVLALYYSAYGHIGTVGRALAEGVRYQGRKVAEVANKLHR
jgi:hypothetical protein